GDVDFLDATVGDGADEVVGCEDHGQRKQSLDGPDVFAILLPAVVDAVHQAQAPGDDGDVDHDQADPGEPITVQPASAGLGHDIQGQPDHAQRSPATEHGVGVNRAKAPEGQPGNVIQIGRQEFQGQVQAVHRADHQPHRGAGQIGINQVRPLGI